LGKIKDCYLFTNAAGKNGDVVVGEDLLIAIVNPAKVDRLNKGRVYAFRSNSSLSAGKKGIKENYLNNQLLWTYSLPFNDLSAPALAADKTLYFCAGKRLYALNVVNGEEKWTLPLLNVVSPPVVEKASRRIYASSSDDRFFAVNSAGRMIWERILDGPIKHAPLADPDGYLYVATDRGTLYKIKG
jgi:outer membrane protein assembly factor BamB